MADFDLADAIRQQAENVARNAKQSNKGGKSSLVDTGTVADPLQQLMQQIQSINIAPTPYETLLQQAQGNAGAQYDPLIQQLQAEMNRTTRRGEANQAEARNMYNALATDIAAEMPQITNQMAQASRETQQRYDQTQQALQGEYDEQAAQQAALYRKLGIQAAAPEASQQAMDDQAYFQQQSQSDEAAAMQLLNQMKNSDVSYNRQSADNTRLAGQNVAADIGAQLEDYLQTAGGKLSGLRAGKESAIQGMLAQLQQQDAERVAQQEETEYDRLMDLFNLQLKMQEMQADQASNSADQLFKGVNGPVGAGNFLGTMYGGESETATGLMDIINSVMEDPAVLAGKYDTGQVDQYGKPITNKVTDAYLQKLLKDKIQANQPSALQFGLAPQYDSADINNAIAALMAYQGKLK